MCALYCYIVWKSLQWYSLVQFLFEKYTVVYNCSCCSMGERIGIIATIILFTAAIDFTKHPQSQEVRFNETVTLQCAVSNGEVIHWLFNNGPLPSESVTTTRGTLVILSFQNELAGKYRCVAQSTDETFSQVSHFARISHFSRCH